MSVFEPGGPPHYFPKGCACASPDENTRLVALFLGGVAEVDLSEDADLQVIRNEAYTQAEAYCVELVPPAADSSTCLEVIDKVENDSDGLTPLFPEGDQDVAYKLGLRTNDVIGSLNSISLTGWDAAIAAHEQLKSEKTFTFVVIRSGTPVTLVYEVE